MHQNYISAGICHSGNFMILIVTICEKFKFDFNKEGMQNYWSPCVVFHLVRALTTAVYIQDNELHITILLDQLIVTKIIKKLCHDAAQSFITLITNACYWTVKLILLLCRHLNLFIFYRKFLLGFLDP